MTQPVVVSLGGQEFLRSETTGTIHIVVDAGAWRVAALCGTRNLTGELVTTTADKIWRNPDLCRTCAKGLKRDA